MFKIRKGVAQLFLLLTIVFMVFVGVLWAAKNGYINTKKEASLFSPTPSITNTGICDVDRDYRSDAQVQDNCVCPQNYSKEFTVTGFGPCKVQGMTDCPSATFKCVQNLIPWEVAVKKIENCEISSVFQSHQLEVTLKSKDGIVYTTKEAKIDNINGVVNSVKDKCPILSATE